jgi:hypothetical protein
MSGVRINLVGKVFGNLTVLGLSEKRLRNVPSWECKCLCGNLKISAGPDLRTGAVTSCGCLQHKGSPKDIEGKRFGNLVAVSREGVSGNGDYRWLCKCDCGENFHPTIGQLNDGRATSCGCKTFEKFSVAKTTHGMSKSPEYNSYINARDRILNEDDLEYINYGATGLEFEEDWLSFETFIKEIGLMPKDGVKYSIDRIDNNFGYVRGNVRWATNDQQARNKTFQVNNTSGISGVMWDNKMHPNGLTSTLYANAVWNTLEHKQTKKCFSTKKFGLLPAFLMACNYRDKMIAELNEQGAGYSASHGL